MYRYNTTPMQINLESLPDNATDALKDVVRQKVERLGKFYSRIVEADVYLKDTGDDDNPCAAEIRLNVPNDRLFCEERGGSFEEAIDSASRAMERQVKRFKDKVATH